MFRRTIGSIKKFFRKDIDAPDSLKIAERTQPNADGYDYRLSLGEPDGPSFRFLAVGDSGDGGRKERAKFQVADAMAAEDRATPCDFILHLGDVVYLSGASDGYPERFLEPYHHWLQNGKDHPYDNMIFTTPFLPIYGNHDYFDFDNIDVVGPIAGKLFREKIGNGSRNGAVFEEAFVETRARQKIRNGALPYVSGRRGHPGPNDQTRIPNRYYWFTYGPCALIALDSNTLDGEPVPPAQHDGRLEAQREQARRHLGKLREDLDRLEDAVEDGELSLAEAEPRVGEIVDDLAETEKEIRMLTRVLEARAEDHDKDQLDWLRRVLGHEDVRDKPWKIVYLHHALYVSEESHTGDPESLGLRENLRSLLVEGGVQLVLCGHAHCFEWVQRRGGDALSDAERKICYVVSGGGGRGLRGSVLERPTPEFEEDDIDDMDDPVLRRQLQFLDVAESKAFARTHNYLSIEVRGDELRVTPVAVGQEGLAGSTLRAVRLSGKKEPVAGRSGFRRLHRQAQEVKLRHIRVSRDQEPQGVFA